MTRCREVFPVSDFQKWILHTKKVHLSKEERRRLKYIGPPTVNSCVFCDAKFRADTGNPSWFLMMDHVKEHHIRGYHLAHVRIDWSLVEYLWENGLLTPAEYRELKPIKSAEDVPSPPGLSDDEGLSPIASLEENRHRERQ